MAIIEVGRQCENGVLVLYMVLNIYSINVKKSSDTDIKKKNKINSTL